MSELRWVLSSNNINGATTVYSVIYLNAFIFCQKNGRMVVPSSVFKKQLSSFHFLTGGGKSG